MNEGFLERVVPAEVLEESIEDGFEALSADVGLAMVALAGGGARGARKLVPVVAEAVVELALFGVFEGFVGFADLFEPAFGLGVVGIDVRMVLAGETPIGAFDLLFVGFAVDAEDFVIVLAHASSMLKDLSLSYSSNGVEGHLVSGPSAIVNVWRGVL